MSSSVQPGVLALGTTDHCYLELDATGSPSSLVSAVVAAAASLASNGGVNAVVGFRPSVWASVDAPVDGTSDWTEPITGPDGFTMPATPHDAWIWLAGGDRGVVFDSALAVAGAVASTASVATETTGWVYRHDRDLTGFIDGSANPDPVEAPAVVTAPDGSSIVLFQLWPHDSAAWTRLDVEAQEKVIGRTKADSVEFADGVKPADAHNARTVVDVDGVERDIYRRNVAYGGPAEHGTIFVGFSSSQGLLHEMLLRMAGASSDGGPRDALTYYTTPTTGAYYVVPSLAALARLAPPPADD